LVQELVIAQLTTYQKIRHRGLFTDLGFSHFYFSCKNYQETAQARITNVVLLFTRNPTKLGLIFPDFAMIFYRIYKFQPKVKYHSRIKFHRGPWNFLAFIDMPSALTIRALQVLQSHHRGPRRRRGLAAGEEATGLGRGKVQGARDAHPRAIGGVDWCGDNPGEPARRCKVAAATAARAPARGVAMRRNWQQL
jgi:hypothetical protein